jgi:aryl-alcohol dehydrogenase-like predicted oxidoreductase
VALAWLLHQGAVTSVIVGAKTREQLLDNLAATAVKLTSENLSALNQVSALTPEYPGWMVERMGSDRLNILR